MKRPSFQFYPGDWKLNANLRRCSEAARGAWMDILCVLHDEDEYGVARYPLADLARAAGVPLRLAKELALRTVLKGSDGGPVAYVHTKTHAGKEEKITLLTANGPCWFSSRMLKDEWLRSVRGGATRFTAENQPQIRPTGEPTGSPDRPFGYRQGDGASTSSSSSVSKKKEDSFVGTASPPPRKHAYPTEFDEQFWKPYPTDSLMSKKQAFEKWKRLNAEDRLKAAAAIPAFKRYCQDHPDYRPIHAERFISHRRFDGFVDAKSNGSALIEAYPGQTRIEALESEARRQREAEHVQ